MNVLMRSLYLYCFIPLFVNYTCGFANNFIISIGKKYIQSHSVSASALQDCHYEYQYDWISGEVPWEFIEPEKTDDYLILYDKELVETQCTPVKIDTQTINVETDNNEFENSMITKAIVSGVMKGIYIQIVSIDNMITYTQCYTNKVIDMDIVLSLLYVILYETNKFDEKNNILTLKKYNNIQLFEKYIKMRRVSMLAIIIIYVLLFRGISNVE